MSDYTEFCRRFGYDPNNPYAEDRYEEWLRYEDCYEIHGEEEF